jgi:hypothetical protein
MEAARVSARLLHFLLGSRPNRASVSGRNRKQMMRRLEIHEKLLSFLIYDLSRTRYNT